MIGSVYEGAVLLSGEAHKITYSVSLDAEMEITPSTRCHTATYSDSDELYTMKSGYGIQIKVTPTITGDTEYCTDTQYAVFGIQFQPPVFCKIQPTA